MSNTELAKVTEQKGLELGIIARRRRVVSLVLLLVLSTFGWLPAVATGHPSLIAISILWLCITGAFAVMLWCYALGKRAYNAVTSDNPLRARQLVKQSVRVNFALFPFSGYGIGYAINAQLALMLAESKFVESYVLSEILLVAIKRSTLFVPRSWASFFRTYQALALIGQSRFAEARTVLKECAASSTGAGKAVVMNNMAVCEYLQQNYKEAYRILKDCTELVKSRDQKVIRLLLIYPTLARVCSKTEAYEEARHLLEESSRFIDTGKCPFLYKSNYYVAQGELCAAEGALEEAEQHFETAIGQMRTFMADTNPRMTNTMFSLADVLEKLGKKTQADEIRSTAAANKELLCRQIETTEKLIVDTADGDFIYKLGMNQ